MPTTVDAAAFGGILPGNDIGFSIDPELAHMTKREQKRYMKMARKQLNRELKRAKGEIRDARREGAKMNKRQADDAANVARRLQKRSRALEKKSAEQKAARGRADNTVDAIGYNLMFENGICEVEDGYFSETLAFDDITYQNAREADQRVILATTAGIYNYFSDDVTVQFSIVNQPLRDDEIKSRQFYDPDAQTSEALREDAETMNEVLSQKLKQGVSNIARKRYLTIAVPADNPDAAYKRLSGINNNLSTSFEQIDCHLAALDGEGRLEAMDGLLNPGREFSFKYEKMFNGLFENTKDYIAPMAIDFAPDGSTSCFKMGDKWCQVMIMRHLDSPLDDNCIANLVDTQLPICVSWYLKPWNKAQAINAVKVSRAWIDKEIIEEQKKAVQQGYDYSILPSEVQYSRDETDDLLTKLQGQQQHLFDFTGLVFTWAETKEKLIENVMQIMDVGSSSGITIEALEYRQRQGLNSILPLGLNHVDISRPLLTSEACILVPYATQELDQEGGSWYYQNKLSNNLVFGNRANLSSPVGFISGKTGSGKGFFAKNEIMGTLLSKPDDQVIIFDRAGEYRLLVEHVGGTYATFGVGHPAHMNPLGMTGLEHQDFGTQVAFKADAMIAQAAAAASESNTIFSEEERSIIQRAIENVYRRWQGAGPGAREPILSDFYDELRRQPEGIAQSIALRYERYVAGVSDFFNHPTDIDLDSRVIGLNFKEVPDSMLVFALISFCETVRFIMYRNFERGRRTWLYIEEMESLFKYPSVLNYFRRFSNECRKFGMYLTGITQSTESMIRNNDANAIVKNSDFVVLLRQSKEDRDYWANALGLSPAEVACIDSSAQRGWGLLVFGSARIPIKGEFPTDNPIYELFSTDPNEWKPERTYTAASGADGAGDGSDAPVPSSDVPDGKKFRRRRRRKKGGNGSAESAPGTASPSDTGSFSIDDAAKLDRMMNGF